MNPRLLISLCLLPLAACGLWVNYEQPATEKPAAWQGTVDANAPVWPDKQWWEQFKSPELTALMEQAHAANFDIKAAVARIEQADAQRRIAGSYLLPSVDATAGVSKGSEPVSSVPGSTGHPKVKTVNAALNASYELDFWGKNASAELAAEAAEDASRYDAETIRLTIEASVANTYFDALATKARIATAQENLTNAQDALKAIQLRFKQGVATELDVAQQESVVAAQTVALPPLQLQWRKDLDALAILVGKLPESMTEPQGALMEVAIPTVAPGLPSELLLRRPDVQNAEAQLIAADANIVNARAQFFPSVALTGALGYQSTSLGNLLRPDSMLWSLGASLTQPIFEGGLLFGNLQLNKARYDELLQNYRKSVIAAFSDVEDSLESVKQNDAQEKGQQDAATIADRAYHLSQKQFQGGIIDITTVLNTQRTLFAAQDQLLVARLTHLQAIVGLYGALGGGWQHVNDTVKK